MRVGNRHVAAAAELRLYEAESSPEQVAARFGLDPAEIVDFSLNVNPFGPPPSSVRAVCAAAARGNAYPDLRLARLRRRLAAWHGVEPDALFFGAGLDDVLKLVLQAWTAEGDRVLIHVPTFPRYELEARLRGAVPLLVPSDPPWRIDPDLLRAALGATDVALAFLCSPNNPTGALIPVETIARLAEDFPATCFVVDEALIDPAEPGAVPLVASRDNLVVLRTFSKYFGLAGFRVGYAVAPPALVRSAEAVRPPFNVALASEAAALAALDDAPFLEATRRAFAAERAFFENAVARIGGCAVRGGYANMLLLELDGVGSEAFGDALAARGLLVADGRSFRGLEQVDTVRISLRDRAANERLVTALEAVL